MNQSFKPLVQSALAYLAIRNRSRLEIEQYLAKKTSDPDLIDQVISYLIDHKLIDDLVFGTQWADARIRRSKGDIRIAQELKLKGISREQGQQILANIDKSVWLASMEQLLDKKKLKFGPQLSYQQRSKIYQVLYAAGFSSTLIDAFLRGRVE